MHSHLRYLKHETRRARTAPHAALSVAMTARPGDARPPKRHITLPEGRALLEDGGGFVPTPAGRAAAARAHPMRMCFFAVNVPCEGGDGGANSVSSSQSSASLEGRVRAVASSSSMEARRASGEGEHALAEGAYVAFNFGHTMRCFAYGRSNGKGISRRSPLDQLAFEDATPTCVEINAMTRSPAHVDAAIGLTSGEIILRDLVSKATRRMNKEGCATKSPPTCIRWVPGSESQLVAACADGSLYVYDTDRERTDFQPLAAPPSADAPPDGVVVVRARGARHNPFCRWYFGPSVGAVTEIAFSPDCRHLAVVAKDGRLRVCDFASERVTQCFRSYFGGLNCVAWSPDGKFILTGGEDDLVSVWSVEEARLVLRCQGHMSWVSAVAFDPHTSDHATYRFGSAGEDTQLLVWEFDRLSMLRPRRSTLLAEDGRPQATRLLDAVPLIAPIAKQPVHGEPLTALAFRSDAIVTACHGGEIRVWTRPQSQRVTANGEDGRPAPDTPSTS